MHIALATTRSRLPLPANARWPDGVWDIEALARGSMSVVLFSPRTASHIPLWEQQLSVGAACMTLLNATHALGFAGGWLTGWPSYSDTVRDAFGADPERIAGFFFLGTPAKQLEERPRPDMSTIITMYEP